MSVQDATGETAPTRPEGGGRLAALALTAAVIGVCCCVAAVALHLWLAGRGIATVFSVADLVLGTAWPLVGSFIVWRQPHNLVGWLLVAPSPLGPYMLLGRYATASAAFGPLPGAAFASWVATWGFAVWFYVVPLLPLFFPDGRLPSRRWRPVVIGIITVATAATIGAMVHPGRADVSPLVINPVGMDWPPALEAAMRVTMVLIFLVGIPLAVASLVVRTRRAIGVERAQLQWLMLSCLAVVCWVAMVALFRGNWFVYEIASAAALLSPVVGIGGAMLRHQLFDVALVLNRTIVLLVLTALGVGLYVAIVVGIDAVAPDSLVGVLTVAAVALLAATGRDTVQAGVDRLLFGLRHDPYAVVARVGTHVAPAAEPVEALQRLVDALRTTLRLPYAAFTGAAVEVESGAPVAGWHAVAAQALGRPVGELRVGRRRAGERLSAREQAAVQEVATRAATLAYAAGLLVDISASRARIVLAREEERRRLRDDLHDGIGPTLAGITYQLEALARRLPDDHGDDLAERAGHLVERLRSAVGEVRAVAHGLQSPVLDQLGLAGALRELVAGFETPRCTAHISDELGPLPAAVEVTVYAIAAEAVTNAMRHSAASRLELHVATDDRTLTLQIRDNGCGLPARPRTGVGLRSMGERAAELGGRLDLLPVPGGGTLVRATLPLETR
ncbi:sensor histidine kinase [Streptosporangium longisporum]